MTHAELLKEANKYAATIGDTVVDIDDLCLGNVEQCRPMAEHIVDLLNQKWK